MTPIKFYVLVAVTDEGYSHVHKTIYRFAQDAQDVADYLNENPASPGGIYYHVDSVDMLG